MLARKISHRSSSMKRFLRALAVVVMVCVSGSAVPGLRSPVRIGVDPTSWRQRCPAHFRFDGTMTSRGAGTVYYHWERSDGSSTPRQSHTFSGPNQEFQVRNEWN